MLVEILLILMGLSALFITHQRKILRYMYDHVPNDTYRQFILRLLAAMDEPDDNETIGILTDGIHALTGTSAMRSIKYLSQEEVMCPITLDPIKKGEDVIILTCGHMAKKEAMLEWLREDSTCPVCRKWILTRS